MNIPVVARWALLALALLQFLLAVRALRRALRARPGQRTGPSLDAADHGIGVVLATALAYPHGTLAFCTMLLLGPVIVWKGVRDVRARREARAATGATGPADGDGDGDGDCGTAVGRPGV
ncbi:hypothetical protein [Streptomyces sp. NBC_01205]|uniref:hypothetical protein n=1 Tax=Streptomyces sp. NBC_01205 TaxID=2903771 RepID=UPI002E15FC30|nr:hypothetical protein OG573_05385 [Streptomyces sp. NBC_01205]